MKKSVFARAVIAGVLLLSLPTAAHAASGDDYTPGVDESYTLAGSTVAAVCENNVPWITYSVVMTDPKNEATTNSASLVLSNGSKSTTLALGQLDSNGKLSGSVLWPGASVDGSGDAAGWPGWKNVDGSWTETSGNFAWTRGNISATVVVNPQLSVALSYPTSGVGCAPVTGEAAGVGDDVTLAVTGGDFEALPWLAGGAAILLVGAGLLAYSRRRAL